MGGSDKGIPEINLAVLPEVQSVQILQHSNCTPEYIFQRNIFLGNFHTVP